MIRFEMAKDMPTSLNGKDNFVISVLTSFQVFKIREDSPF